MSRLTDDEKRAIIARRLSDTLTGNDSELRADREKALDYYFGRPLGNEIEGRAQVVTKDVMDVIEWSMPSLMRVVTSRECVQFDPTGPGDDEMAKREGAFISHVIWKKNPGYELMYNWLKDGLMQKVGYLHYYWDSAEKTEFDHYEGLTEDQLAMLADELAADYEVKVVGSRQADDGTWSIKLRKTKKGKGCIRMDVYPPDEVVVDKDCRGSIKNAKFVGLMRRNVTRSELVEMGFSKSRVKEMTSYTWSEERDERRARDTVGETREGDRNDTGDWATEEITLLKCWTYLDADDDGVAELRQMLLAGNEILEDEEFSEIPWESWTPTPIPHRHVGLSVYDRMESEMRIHTALWRGVLDNTYFTQNQRIAFDQNTVNVAHLQVNRPGGHVAVKGPPGASLMPVPVTPMQSQILPVIELVKTTIERRTGVGRMTAGLDADTLSKSTKGAYIDAKTSSNQLVEAMASIFAHMGLASLYCSLHRMSRRHQNYETSFQIGKEWISVNPSEWLERESLTVNVGSTTKEEVRTNLTVMATAQTQAAAAGIIGPKQVYNLFLEIQNNLGFEGRQFAMDPESPEFEQFQEQNKPAEQPDPNAGYLQGEMIKAQTKMQEKQIDAELKTRELDQRGAIDVAKIELEYSRDLAAPGIGAELPNAGESAAKGGARQAAARRQPAG